MTSIVGGQLRGEVLGFCAEGRKTELAKAVEQSFTPEFLGRLDETVHFQPLGQEAMVSIAWKYLHQLQERVQAAGTRLELPQKLAEDLGNSPGGKSGARQLRRMVQTRVEAPLASFLLRCAIRPKEVRVEMEGDMLRFY